MKSAFLLTLMLLLPQVFTGDGEAGGRQGNALYKQELYEEAADAYYGGLSTYQGDKPADEIYYGLQNNLGAALHRQEDYEMAQSVFAKALESAPTQADYARAAYNAGNNAFRGEQAEAALEHYKNALLADPTNADAKYNYEFVKRQLEEQQEQQQNQENNDEQNDEQNQDQQQQNQDQQQNEDQQNQDQQQQNQDQQNQDQQQQEQQQQQPQPDQQLSRQQAERILQALENEEEQLLREVQKMKGRPRRVEKDW